MTNILQHKSWHVWNRDNRAKVEKDVAAHKEVEEKKRKRVLEIEQEIRYTALKEKTKKRKEEIESTDDDPDAYKRATAVIPYKESTPVDEKPQHINFFADIEAGAGQLVAGDRNAEYEAEKKAEKQKEDRQNTNYLVPPQTSDFKVAAPWYALSKIENTEVALPEPKRDDKKDDKEVKEAELKKKKDERLKNKEDPLQAMNKYLGAKKTAKKVKKEQDKEDTKASSISKMREDRIKREAEERKKVSQLLYGNKEQQSSNSGSSGYNNSFVNYSGGVLRGGDNQHRRSSNEHHRGKR